MPKKTTIGPVKEKSFRDQLADLRAYLFGGEPDAVAEQAAAESDEFNARINRRGGIGTVEMIRSLPFWTDPGINDTPAGIGDDVLKAITRFDTPEARRLALDALQLEGTKVDEVQKAIFEWLKKRYPRVMAHTNRIGVAPLDPGVMGVNSPRTGIDDALGNKGVASITIDPGVKGDDFAEALGHELTHTAQKLGLGGKYRQRAVSSTTSGPMYEFNPLEVSARKGGAKVKEAYRKTKGERRALRSEERIPADWSERAASVDPNGPLFTMPMSELKKGVTYNPEAVWQEHIGNVDWDTMLKLIGGK
jgi:hypothetical protein